MKLKYLLRYIYLTQRIDLIEDKTNEVLAVDYYKGTYDRWEVEAITAMDIWKLEIKIKKPKNKHKDLRRQLRTYCQQGEIGVKIAKGILDDLVKKGKLTTEEAEDIALDLKI